MLEGLEGPSGSDSTTADVGATASPGARPAQVEPAGVPAGLMEDVEVAAAAAVGDAPGEAAPSSSAAPAAAERRTPTYVELCNLVFDSEQGLLDKLAELGIGEDELTKEPLVDPGKRKRFRYAVSSTYGRTFLTEPTVIDGTKGRLTPNGAMWIIERLKGKKGA